MYKYNHDCPFEAFITNLHEYNNGKVIGKWLKFPANEIDFNNTLMEIGVNSRYREWFVSDYGFYVDGIKDKFSSFS